MTTQPLEVDPSEEGDQTASRRAAFRGSTPTRVGDDPTVAVPMVDSDFFAATEEEEDEDVVVPSRVFGYRRRPRFEARKVRRLIRHIDPWSVLKLSVLLALSGWLVVMIASTILWQVAITAGTVESIEKFVNTSFELENWQLDGSFLFRQVGLIALIVAFSFAGAVVVATMIFNLISDIIGGVWVTVVEEESARPVTTRAG